MYTVNYILRFNLSVCVTDMAVDSIITVADAGKIAAGFAIVYGSGQFINGLLGDKIHPKHMIFIGALGSALASTSVGFASSYEIILILWCIDGFFCAMLWAPIIRCCSEFLVEDHRKRVVHLSLTSPIGTIISYLISAMCLRYFGWRYVFIFSGIIAAVSSVLWLFSMKFLDKYMKFASGITSGIKNEKKTVQRQNINIFKLMLITGLFFTVVCVMCNGVIKEGVHTYAPSYLSAVHSVSSDIVSVVTTILPIVVVIGNYITYFLNMRIFKNEMLTCGVLYVICFVSVGGIMIFKDTNIILSAVLFAVSSASMAGINNMCLTYIPMSFAAVGKSATITGLFDAFVYLAAALSGVISSEILEAAGWDGIIILWLLIATVGIIVCFIGKVFWARGKEKIN